MRFGPIQRFCYHFPYSSAVAPFGRSTNPNCVQFRQFSARVVLLAPEATCIVQWTNVGLEAVEYLLSNC